MLEFLGWTLVAALSIGALVGVGLNEQEAAQKKFKIENPIEYTKKVKVISEPLGARIEVNDDYICDTPCSIDLKVWEDYSLARRYKIIAYPIYSGQQTQFKFLRGGNKYNRSSNDKAPTRIFFDMNLIRQIPDTEIDVDVNVW
jgi:hypothetical protein